MSLTIQHSILRRSLAGILLMLFAFSIMPKKILHDWIVSHTDGVSATAKSEVAQVGKAGFNCNCQNLVAESPFTADNQCIDFALHLSHATRPGTSPSQVYTADLFFYSLRGPPAIS
jgi:hypothetical protein